MFNAAISPDGKYLGYADQQGIHLQLVETKAAQNLPLLPGDQDGESFLGNSGVGFLTPHDLQHLPACQEGRAPYG